VTVALRPAHAGDAASLAEIVSHGEVAPFLAAARSATPAELLAEIERAVREPEAFGMLVIEERGATVGTVTWERVNRRSRIASVGGLALLPAARGHGIATAAMRLLVEHLIHEQGFHRVQLEVYAFNDRALSFFASVGFTREGVRRKAYWREGRWVDGVLFGLVEEDLGAGA
jgi:RimJ/RimL family protein N-acetyltransferase